MSKCIASIDAFGNDRSSGPIWISGLVIFVGFYRCIGGLPIAEGEDTNAVVSTVDRRKNHQSENPNII